MPNALKWNAVVAAALAAAAWAAFMFAKHDGALGSIIPFGNDPYDAVGSFAVLGGMLLALLSLARAFRPRRTETSPDAEVHLVRAEAAIVLTVYVMVASDAVAMARHPSAWVGAPPEKKLIALIIGLTALATGTLLLVKRSCRHRRAAVRKQWATAIVVAAACALALGFYPERLTSALGPHMLTILFGDVVLFAPIGFLLPAMFPSEDHPASVGAGDDGPVGWVRWGLVVLVGIALGFAILAGELREGGLPAGRLLLVGAVYLGLTIAGILTAYVFIGKPIGLRT